MCGIAGFLDTSKTISEPLAILKSMSAVLKHRGPNDEGYYLSPDHRIGLAHRRLSIIDLSPAGHQPMSDEGDSYFITYNGEVYNFVELRRELHGLGYRFRGRSDTEVVLKSYIQWGLDCFRRFNGMFALAIWDSQKQELVLARDRFGKKPLYYQRMGGNGAVFASELTALWSGEHRERKLCYPAINCFLALGYILSPMTLYEDIFKLEPACYLRISEDGNRWEKVRYWDYAAQFRKKCTDSLEDAAVNILQLLDQAVSRRLVSDVPVGAFLSGGLDSSSVVSLMKKYHRGELHTFSMGFEADTYSELPDADKAAVTLGTIHHSRICGMDDGLALIRSALEAYDEPFADTSLVPMVQVSQVAAERVTVVLSGDGADEIFGGYITYQADQIHHWMRPVPALAKRLALWCVERLGQGRQVKLGWKYKAQQFLSGSTHTPQKAHYLWRLMLNEEERVALLGEEHRDMVFDTDPYHIFAAYYAEVADLPPIDQNLYVDCKTWLPDDILVKVDRATMRSSIEARCPYLDPDLAAYVASLPPEYKIRGLETKFVLKKALQRQLPEFILKKKKSGFNSPVGVWLKVKGDNEFAAFTRFVFETRIKGAGKGDMSQGKPSQPPWKQSSKGGTLC